MKIQIELNAKCINCVHWVFETSDGMSFLKENETYCKLSNTPQIASSECDKLELHLDDLEDNLNNAGFTSIKIKENNV